MNRFSSIFLFVVLAAGVFKAEGDISNPDGLSYVMDDFELRPPGIWKGRPDVKSAVAEVDAQSFHSGTRAARITWDLGDARGENCFVNFTLNKQLAGRPVSARLWALWKGERRNEQLQLWLQDLSGETYISYGALTDKEGWQEVTFPISSLQPAWKSGDADGRMEYPLSVMGIVVTSQKGELVIDDLSVFTEGAPREIALVKVKGEQENCIGWGERPTFRIFATNPSMDDLTNVKVRVVITDAISNATVWQDELTIPEMKARQISEAPVLPEIPYGVFDLKWVASDAAGCLPMGSGTLRIARMMGDVSRLSRKDCERLFARKYGWLGGILWSSSIERAARTGAHWERQGNTSLWESTERVDGQYDFSESINRAQKLRDSNLDSIYFNTVYNTPSFRKIDSPDFASAYGRLHLKQAEALRGLVDWFEFGNEDNGPTKFLYTEVARHGAAGVRTADSYAMNLTAGTAQIDVNWLKLQAERGLFDWMDGMVTHPYTWTSSPEEYDILGQYGQVDRLIDSLGGMKIQLSTEFGYPVDFDQKKRAEWTVRHMAISAAAGLLRNGLYAFDDHFGIYQQGDAFPVAASVNAFANFTFAHRFSGWFIRTPDVWAVVFEKAGTPLLMAWSPSGKGVLELPAPIENAFDLYGNRVILADRRSILLTESPVYLPGVSQSVLDVAINNSLRDVQERYSKALQESDLSGSDSWESLATAQKLSGRQIAETLLSLKPDTASISLREQAAVADAVRMLCVAVHAGDMNGMSVFSSADNTDKWRKWRNVLKSSVDEGVDIPALRWLLRTWEHLQDLSALYEEAGNSSGVARIESAGPVMDHLCEIFAEKGGKVFFSLWPYIHAPAEEGKIMERISFIPGKAVPVQVRLNSYLPNDTDAEVRFELPPGWKIEPSEWVGTVPSGGSGEIAFQITATETTQSKISVTVRAKDKPPVSVPFNDFEVLPPIQIEPRVLSGLLPEVPLDIDIVNNSAKTISSKVRILSDKGHPALARFETGKLTSGSSADFAVKLSDAVPVPAFNEWPLIASLTVNGKQLDVPVLPDFDVSVQTTSPPQIDGEISDWSRAAPLHLDKAEYAHGSFGNAYSPEDLSGVFYSMWDKDNFYALVRVKDQLFNQNLTGDSVWQQDSVQLGFALPGGPVEGISLALTPSGPQVWNHTKKKAVGDARMAVKLNQGETVYEVAIPWSELPGGAPRAGEKRRFDILLNDDDAIVNRRFMERYGVGIVNEKGEKYLGNLHFIEESPDKGRRAGGETQDRAVLREDFEEYPDGTIPDAWVVKKQGLIKTTVASGSGYNGSSALKLAGKKEAGDSYLVLTRPLVGLEAGKKYKLRAVVKGGNLNKTDHLIGVCSDLFSVEGFQDVPPWSPSEDWQTVELPFVAPGGSYNVYIRNSLDPAQELLIDELEILPDES